MEQPLTIRQDNALTSSRFEYTALERNLFYSVLGQLKKTDTNNTLYYISVSQLTEATGTKNTYVDYRKATESLLGRVYEIEQENGNLLQVTMFASCLYVRGEGYIEVEISRKLRPYLFELKDNFTSLQLEVALGFKSKFSKRVYEILNQWKSFNNGKKRFELLELKTMLNLYNPKTKKEQYVQWTDFESRVLKVAQKEMNKENCDLTFTYEKHKKGRSFHAITFTIKSKSYQKTIDFKDDNTSVFSDLMNHCELRKDQAQHVIDNFETNDILTKIRRIKMDKMDGKITKSVGGYAAHVFGLLKK